MTFYLTNIKVGNNEWSLEKRFSQFDELNNNLVKLFGKRIPEFPPRTFFKVNTIEGIEGRRNQLDLYLKQLTNKTEIINSILFRDFLEVKIILY